MFYLQALFEDKFGIPWTAPTGIDANSLARILTEVRRLITVTWGIFSPFGVSTLQRSGVSSPIGGSRNLWGVSPPFWVSPHLWGVSAARGVSSPKQQQEKPFNLHACMDACIVVLSVYLLVFVCLFFCVCLQLRVHWSEGKRRYLLDFVGGRRSTPGVSADLFVSQLQAMEEQTLQPVQHVGLTFVPN